MSSGQDGNRSWAQRRPLIQRLHCPAPEKRDRLCEQTREPAYRLASRPQTSHGGLYAGGIAKNSAANSRGKFPEAFTDKGRVSSKVYPHVVLNYK